MTRLSILRSPALAGRRTGAQGYGGFIRPASCAKSAEADDKSIPNRLNTEFPAKADEFDLVQDRCCPIEPKNGLYSRHKLSI